jgi:hypothetical protein
MRPIKELIRVLDEMAPHVEGTEEAGDVQLGRKLAQDALQQAAEGKEAEAQRSYAGARAAYLHLLTANLRARLPETPPQGARPEAWAATRSAALVSLGAAEQHLAHEPPDLKAANEAYEDAARRALNVLLPALNAQVAGLREPLARATGGDAGGPPPEIVAPAREALDAAAASVERAQSRLDAGDLSPALLAYDQGNAQLAQGREAMQKAGLMGDDQATTAPQPMSLPMPGGDELPAMPALALWASGDEQSTAAWLRRGLLVRDAIATLVIAVLSSLVGLQLLWVGNATFGSLNDYIGALLWGFGLHQLNEVTRGAGPQAVAQALTTGQGTNETPSGEDTSP